MKKVIAVTLMALGCGVAHADDLSKIMSTSGVSVAMKFAVPAGECLKKDGLKLTYLDEKKTEQTLDFSKGGDNLDVVIKTCDIVVLKNKNDQAVAASGADVAGMLADGKSMAVHLPIAAGSCFTKNVADQGISFIDKDGVERFLPVKFPLIVNHKSTCDYVVLTRLF